MYDTAMPKRCYTCLIGSIIIVGIPVVFVVYYSPRLHTPIRQPLPSPTHIPPTFPFSQTHSNMTLSPSASLLFNSMSLRTINEIISNCTAECVNKGGAMDPFFVHFIKTDPKWEFYEYVAVRSAVKFIKPDVVFVVTMGEMEANCWWNRTMALPLVKHVMIPAGSDVWVKNIRGKKVVERAHFCDFMKQMLLYEFGGIFMDTDAIAVRSFDHLKNNQVTLARDFRCPTCAVNGLMVSQRHSCFMCRFLQLGYQKFDGLWESNGMDSLQSLVTNELKKFKDAVILEHYNGFFPFSPDVSGWTDFALKNKTDLKVNTTGLYAIHLYHNLLTRPREKGMATMKGRTIDNFSWLNTSKSYAGEVFRSVLPKHFTEEQFNTIVVCAPLIESVHEL